MPSLEDLENLALLGLGGAVGRSPRGTARALVRGGKFVARRYPVGLVALGVYEAYDRGYLSRSRAERILKDVQDSVGSPASGQGGDPTFSRISGKASPGSVKRKVSKANKAMKKAMKATKNNFKQATQIASKANPNTKSKIGKGSSFVKKTARKIRKSVWGTLRRKK